MSTIDAVKSSAGSGLGIGAAQLAIDLEVSRWSGAGHTELQQERTALAQARASAFGFGKLQRYFDDPEVEEIWLNRPDEVFVAVAGQTRREALALNQSEIEAIVERMLRHTGRRLDRSQPFVDAALPDGSRLHVVIPDIAKRHWSINIRRFPKNVWTLRRLAELGTISEQQLRILEEHVAAGANILVSGATQAGKTTVLCALIEQARQNARLITVEETFEIRSTKTDWVALQTRQANLEGEGEVTLRRLVKESLRMRPELLVVGEVREAESLDLLIAMNSGISAMCTIHANSASAAITKLHTLPLLAGANISAQFVEQTVSQCIDLIVHCATSPNGKRRVTEIAQLRGRQQSRLAELG